MLLFPRSSFEATWLTQYTKGWWDWWMDDTLTITTIQYVGDVETRTFKDPMTHKLGYNWKFWNLYAIDNRMNEKPEWSEYTHEPFVIYADTESPLIPMPKEFQGMGLMVKRVRTYDEHKLPLYACAPIDNDTYYNMDTDYTDYLVADYPINDNGTVRRFMMLDRKPEYYLYGVEVPIEYITKKAEEIPVHWIVQEENAERRHALVRKIGIERVLKELHATIIDTQNTYQLVNLDLGDDQQRPYLKMLNPSTEEWHIEGVPPHVCSVNEALAWRNQSEEKPSMLT
uniref:DUF6745 domain-containing protein n=1 Tax=viral metagenome TaxID=1070528 RepID=A0A6M3JMH1_9ZZZZ